MKRPRLTLPIGKYPLTSMYLLVSVTALLILEVLHAFGFLNP